MTITIRRLSDNHKYDFYDVDPSDLVLKLKNRIKDDFMPSFPNGCRLIFEGKVLKSRHRLKYYNIKNEQIIDMDDRRNWSSSSSDSDSTK